MNAKQIMLKEDFTEEEKNLIKKYCDERIAEALKPDMWGINKNLANEKRHLKHKINEVLKSISSLCIEDLYDMVWNREYLDHRHNILNISILVKIENSDYYKNKEKAYIVSQFKYNESQKRKRVNKGD